MKGNLPLEHCLTFKGGDVGTSASRVPLDWKDQLLRKPLVGCSGRPQLRASQFVVKLTEVG